MLRQRFEDGQCVAVKQQRAIDRVLRIPLKRPGVLAGRGRTAAARRFSCGDAGRQRRRYLRELRLDLALAASAGAAMR